MKYLRRYNESSIPKKITIEDLDQIEDLFFLSVADEFKMIQVDYPTTDHVFQDYDETIYRIYTYFWNSGKTAILIDDDWDSEIKSISISVIVLGWFESLCGNEPNESHYDIPQDVYDENKALIDALETFRQRLVKFNYSVMPIKLGVDYYMEIVDNEEITSNGIFLTIEINSKL